MILVDSSVWIDYFRGTPTEEAERLDVLLGLEPIAVGDLILTEVLQGFRNDREFNQAKKLLTSLAVVELGGQETFVQDRLAFVRRCGVPEVLLRQWPNTANSYQEIRAVGDALLADPSLRAIVVSDALHMPRLRFLRDKFALGGRMILQESRLGGRYDPEYCLQVMVFWFREPLAYVYYRLKY